MQLTYAHCVLYTPGQLDRHPHSQYEHHTAGVSLWRVSSAPGDPDDGEAFRVTEGTGIDYNIGNLLGAGKTEEEALSAARYQLMDRSRKTALRNFSCMTV